ncbi:Cyclin-dependent kinase 2-associated protein 1 [Channa argus]|uniref:Cyclin-dependent kinase 2-associated protein 1 n=1 Tax=Channa argus TaxID=215402 RepID=A0A6G1QH17_CHAAH|nr:Cyclin-dependent kinase 2-associated protein 1 [Channa argus]KAK2887992.1 hypothetical protein Q8A73_019440 [Channa argus]
MRSGPFTSNLTFTFLSLCVCVCVIVAKAARAHMDASPHTKPVGSLQYPSAANLATLQSYRPLVSDYGPPSLGFSQGSTGSQVPQNKYAELLAIIEELGKEIRPTYAGSKSAMERLKRGIIHARGLVRECLAETERNARS